MNTNRLQLMVTMLKEVEAGTWKPSLTRTRELVANDRYNDEVVGYNPTAKQLQETPVAFELNTWISSIPENDKHELTCGFTACAVGHAILDPRFNRMGLKPDSDFAPVYKGKPNWYALIKFFDLKEKTLECLFMVSMFPEKLEGKALVVQVRRRIEKLIQLGEEKFRETRVGNTYCNDQYYVSPQGRIYKEYKNA